MSIGGPSFWRSKTHRFGVHEFWDAPISVLDISLGLLHPTRILSKLLVSQVKLQIMQQKKIFGICTDLYSVRPWITSTISWTLGANCSPPVKVKIDLPHWDYAYCLSRWFTCCLSFHRFFSHENKDTESIYYYIIHMSALSRLQLWHVATISGKIKK